MSTITKNFPQVINGDTVVGFTNTKKIKDLGWMDMASLSSWYNDDPLKNHLGLVELFSTMADYRMPSYEGFFKKGAVIEVNGMNGKFTYDLPVKKTYGIYTTGDTSTYSEAPGIDGTVFPLELDQPFTSGDVLTYDAMYGEQVVVSSEHEVEQIGDSWVHWVIYNTTDKSGWFPAEYLKPGIQYFKIGHTLGEYSTEFSNIQSPGTAGTITCEFELGNHRGVETFYTMYADRKKLNGADMRSQDFWDYFMQEQQKLGVDGYGKPLDMFYVAKINPTTRKIDNRTVRIGAALEYLVVFELMKLEVFQLFFQKGGFINDITGTKRLNEGIFHQFRRGFTITYGKPGGINKTHIKRAVAYLFAANKSLKPHERRIKFKCGYMAYMNMLTLFRDEVLAQLDGIQMLLGMDSVLPKSPVSGADLTSLAFNPVMFTKVNIPEIGIVEIEHEPTLDYLPMTDRRSQGFFGDGYARTSYSMVIYDATSAEYSNALTGLNGAKLVGAGGGENIFYVTPEGGNSLQWGYEAGRYSPNSASEIASSMKRMGREFWAHSVSAGFVKDLSRVITIELKY